MSIVNSFNDFKLFVGNMPGDVTTDEISTVFSQFGQVVEVYIMSGSRSRSGQSSAFVKFANMESCHATIAAMHMKGRLRQGDTALLSVRFAKAGPSPIRAPSSDPQIIGAVFESKPPSTSQAFISSDGSATASSTPSSTPLSSPTSYRQLSTGLTKLFVGGLAPFIDRDDLIAIFAAYGRVESVHLMKNNKSKSGQSCAFINYYVRTDAGRAIESLGGKYVVDEELPPITVRFADMHEEGSNKRQKIAGVSSVDELSRRLAEQAAADILARS